MRRGSRNEGAKLLQTPQSVNAAVKSICDIMRRSNCAGALLRRAVSGGLS